MVHAGDVLARMDATGPRRNCNRRKVQITKAESEKTTAEAQIVHAHHHWEHGADE